MPGFIHTVQLAKHRIKGLQSDIRSLTGAASRDFTAATGHRMLTFHGLCSHSPLRFNTLFITANTFERQLQLYKKYCHILTADEYFAGTFRNDRFNISLSFDDGFANNLNIVLPLLEKYQVPAIFFITGISSTAHTALWNDVLCAAYRYGPSLVYFRGETYSKGKDMRYASPEGEPLANVLRTVSFREKESVIGQLKQYCRANEHEYWLQLNQEQIATLAQSPWATIGCHGLFHDDLACMPAAQVQEELIRCRQYLESIADKPVKALAFPYGSYTGDVLTAATAAGFTQLYADRFHGDNALQHPFLRERFTINPFINPVNQHYATIRGKY